MPKRALFSARIMPIWPPGRNDRPSKSSKLLFRFSLGTAGPFNVGDAMPAGQMELVGPPGTVIPTRCYHLVEPLAQCSDHSFAEFTGPEWSSSLAPSSTQRS